MTEQQSNHSYTNSKIKIENQQTSTVGPSDRGRLQQTNLRTVSVRGKEYSQNQIDAVHMKYSYLSRSKSPVYKSNVGASIFQNLSQGVQSGQIDPITRSMLDNRQQSLQGNIQVNQNEYTEQNTRIAEQLIIKYNGEDALRKSKQRQDEVDEITRELLRKQEAAMVDKTLEEEVVKFDKDLCKEDTQSHGSKVSSEEIILCNLI